MGSNVTSKPTGSDGGGVVMVMVAAGRRVDGVGRRCSDLLQCR